MSAAILAQPPPDQFQRLGGLLILSGRRIPLAQIITYYPNAAAEITFVFSTGGTHNFYFAHPEDETRAAWQRYALASLDSFFAGDGPAPPPPASATPPTLAPVPALALNQLTSGGTALTVFETEAILALVAEEYGHTLEGLKGRRRSEPFNIARAAAVWLMRNALPESLSYRIIGASLGGRDHGTAMALADSAERRRIASPWFQSSLTRLSSLVPGHARPRKPARV